MIQNCRRPISVLHEKCGSLRYRVVSTVRYIFSITVTFLLKSKISLSKKADHQTDGCQKLIFTAQAAMLVWFMSRKIISPSVYCLSVHLSNACIVTKLNDALRIF